MDSSKCPENRERSLGLWNGAFFKNINLVLRPSFLAQSYQWTSKYLKSYGLK